MAYDHKADAAHRKQPFRIRLEPDKFALMGLGMIIFAVWSICVFWLILRKRMLIWTAASIIPILAVAAGYYFDIRSGADDEFGTRPLTQILFLGMCFVVASSGTLSMVLPRKI